MSNSLPKTTNQTTTTSQQQGEIEFGKIKQHFTSSALTYKNHAQLQQDVGGHLLSLLHNDGLSAEQNVSRLLDLGSGPGLFSRQLQDISQSLLSLDLSFAMLQAQQQGTPNRQTKVQANSHALPFIPNSFDCVFSSLMVQWCDLEQVLSQVYTVLKPGATAYISTLIQGSLFELEHAWAQVDKDTHVHQYLSKPLLINTVNQQGWSRISIQNEQNVYWFDSALSLAKELKSLGANFVEGRKHKGLMPKSKWLAMEQAYKNKFYDVGQDAIPATYQVVYLQLTK